MSLLTSLFASKIAISAIALGTLAGGGTAVAAYAGGLPAPLQQTASTLIGAPAPTRATDAPDATPTPDPVETPDPTVTPMPTTGPAPSTTPVGPDAAGAAKFGLCNAFIHGGLSITSTAYQALSTAAGGPTDIPAFCATAPAPGKSGDHKPSIASAPAPTSPPTATPTAPVTHGESGTAHGGKPAIGGRP